MSLVTATARLGKPRTCTLSMIVMIDPLDDRDDVTRGRARVRRPRQRLGGVTGFGRGIALELDLFEAARALEDRFDAVTLEVQFEQKRGFEDSA